MQHLCKLLQVRPVKMDISELNSMQPPPTRAVFPSAEEICRDPIVLTTDEQTRYLAVLGYKQSNMTREHGEQQTNVYIVVWDVTTKKSVVRIETNADILNIFASPQSKNLFCLSKNRYWCLLVVKILQAFTHLH